MKSLIKVSETFETLSSRAIGTEAREMLLNKLQQERGKIVIDFDFTNISPSFADEFIGVLAQQLGREKFKGTVSMINVSISNQSILKHVINRRLAVDEHQYVS